MNVFFSVEIKKIGNLDKFHVWFWATSTRDIQPSYLPGSGMRARVRARCELLNCYGFQNLWSNYCTIHLCSAHTKQHYDYFELTGGGGRWEGGWRRTGGHFSYTSCRRDKSRIVVVIITTIIINIPTFEKALEAARLEAAEKSQATSFSNPMFNQVQSRCACVHLDWRVLLMKIHFFGNFLYIIFDIMQLWFVYFPHQFSPTRLIRSRQATCTVRNQAKISPLASRTRFIWRLHRSWWYQWSWRRWWWKGDDLY